MQTLLSDRSNGTRLDPHCNEEVASEDGEAGISDRGTNICKHKSYPAQADLENHTVNLEHSWIYGWALAMLAPGFRGCPSHVFGFLLFLFPADAGIFFVKWLMHYYYYFIFWLSFFSFFAVFCAAFRRIESRPHPLAASALVL